MKRAWLVAGSLLSFSACAPDPTGTYVLDKPAMEKAVDQHIAARPDAKEATTQLAAAVVQTMDVTLVLAEGGHGTLETKILGASHQEDVSWSVERGSVRVKGKDGEMRCALSARVLSCTDEKTLVQPMRLVRK